jgi:hypothetical protein
MLPRDMVVARGDDMGRCETDGVEGFAIGCSGRAAEPGGSAIGCSGLGAFGSGGPISPG